MEDLFLGLWESNWHFGYHMGFILGVPGIKPALWLPLRFYSRGCGNQTGTLVTTYDAKPSFSNTPHVITLAL
jgi:hypothetical protein